jgi:hypothetical protein
MHPLALLPPELATTPHPLCFAIDRYVGPIHVKFRICFSIVAVGNRLKLHIDWGSGHVDLPLITSCQQIFSFSIADIELCISNIHSTNGYVSSFDIALKLCANFPFVGHQCITLLSKHIGLGIFKVADLRAAEAAHEIELDDDFVLTGEYVAFLYEA